MMMIMKLWIKLLSDLAGRQDHILLMSSTCRGFVMADVLVKGLSEGAITPWW